MPKRILIIDDEEAVRNSFQLALEDTDYHVDAADSGEKGLTMVKKTKYDLIFLDLKMPGLNGVETMNRIRESGVETPIYIITAFFAEYFDQLKKAREAGHKFEVIRKPLGGDQILALSKSVLEGNVISDNHTGE